MSTRRPSRPDLALTDRSERWTPAPGHRVRQPHQTSHTQVTQGTARVIMMRVDGRVDVAVDPGPMQRPGDSTWAVWPLDQTIRATDPKDETSA